MHRHWIGHLKSSGASSDSERRRPPAAAPVTGMRGDDATSEAPGCPHAPGEELASRSPGTVTDTGAKDSPQPLQQFFKFSSPARPQRVATTSLSPSATQRPHKGDLRLRCRVNRGSS